MELSKLAQDIRDLCHRVIPGDWEDMGWGNELCILGYRLHVAPVGLMGGSFIQVSVTPVDHPKYSGIPFFRELSRHGHIKNERGEGSVLRMTPDEWLETSLREAHTYMEQHHA